MGMKKLSRSELVAMVSAAEHLTAHDLFVEHFSQFVCRWISKHWLFKKHSDLFAGRLDDPTLSSTLSSHFPDNKKSNLFFGGGDEFAMQDLVINYNCTICCSPTESQTQNSNNLKEPQDKGCSYSPRCSYRIFFAYSAKLEADTTVA